MFPDIVGKTVPAPKTSAPSEWNLPGNPLKRTKSASMNFKVLGTTGFLNSQVTSGGIATNQFDKNTMMSKNDRGLYLVGEILDIDGDCGGYNLMFAFGSGILAGLAGRTCPW